MKTTKRKKTAWTIVQTKQGLACSLFTKNKALPARMGNHVSPKKEEKRYCSCADQETKRPREWFQYVQRPAFQ